MTRLLSRILLKTDLTKDLACLSYVSQEPLWRCYRITIIQNRASLMASSAGTSLSGKVDLDRRTTVSKIKSCAPQKGFTRIVNCRWKSILFRGMPVFCPLFLCWHGVPWIPTYHKTCDCFCGRLSTSINAWPNCALGTVFCSASMFILLDDCLPWRKSQCPARPLTMVTPTYWVAPIFWERNNLQSPSALLVFFGL